MKNILYPDYRYRMKNNLIMIILDLYKSLHILK